MLLECWNWSESRALWKIFSTIRDEARVKVLVNFGSLLENAIRGTGKTQGKAPEANAATSCIALQESAGHPDEVGVTFCLPFPHLLPSNGFSDWTGAG